jgi:hypothetical protein
MFKFATRSIRFLDSRSLLASAPLLVEDSLIDVADEQVPPGKVKSILPCTPLAVVKCLEHLGVYNRILRYGDRAYGRVVTIINRSVKQAGYVWTLSDISMSDPKWWADRLQPFWRTTVLVCFQ